MIQIVRREANPLYHDILVDFTRHQVPALVSTSFNVRRADRQPPGVRAGEAHRFVVTKRALYALGELRGQLAEGPMAHRPGICSFPAATWDRTDIGSVHATFSARRHTHRLGAKCVLAAFAPSAAAPSFDTSIRTDPLSPT